MWEGNGVIDTSAPMVAECRAVYRPEPLAGSHEEAAPARARPLPELRDTSLLTPAKSQILTSASGQGTKSIREMEEPAIVVQNLCWN